MNREEIAAKIKDKAVDGKIACKVALALADELGVPSRRIGEIATEERIRIAACQLGCFK